MATKKRKPYELPKIKERKPFNSPSQSSKENITTEIKSINRFFIDDRNNPRKRNTPNAFTQSNLDLRGNFLKAVTDQEQNKNLKGRGSVGNYCMKNSLVKNKERISFNPFKESQLTVQPRMSQVESDVKSYLSKIGDIIEKGSRAQKQTSTILKKAEKLEKNIGKRFMKLRENSDSIINGVQIYYLEEEKNKNYKYDLREMWMRTDR